MAPILNVKGLVGAFNREKALVGGFFRDCEKGYISSYQTRALSFNILCFVVWMMKQEQ